MESTATAEQAEPQGSAAPASAASAEDFGALFKAHVFKQAPQSAATQSEVSSADREPSATDEQPATDASLAGTPEASEDGTGDESETPEQQGTTDQPKLSRAQRKALKQGQTAATVSTDTSAQAPPADDADPVQRVERVLNDRLGRLEALLAAPNPSQTDPNLAAASTQYAQTFGNDAEFQRRAEIAIRPSGDKFLSAPEALEMERWASNREVKNQIDQTYRGNLSAIVVKAAQAHGLDPNAVLSTPTFDDTYRVFYEHGKKAGAQEGTAAVSERISKLEATNRQLADENDALRQRAPAGARAVLKGGFPTGAAGALADKTGLSGRELMMRGLQPPQVVRRPSGSSRP